MFLQSMLLRCDGFLSLEFSTLSMLTGNLMVEFHVFCVSAKITRVRPVCATPHSRQKHPLSRRVTHRKQSTGPRCMAIDCGSEALRTG